MKITIKTKYIGDVKERFSGDFERQIEDKTEEDRTEEYIKRNIGIKK